MVNLGKGGKKEAEHAAAGVIKKNADKVFTKADVPRHAGEGGGHVPHGRSHGYPDDPLFAAANRDVDLDRITPPGWVRRTDERPIIRSDPRGPDEIFENGFQPRNVGPDGNYDLDRHITHNQPGPFVSTSYGDEVTDGLEGEWRYDIDAPGGIDMRRSPGARAGDGEAEVAFPGGIDRRFIQGAQLYGPGDQPVGPYRVNPHYRNWRHG